MSVDTQIKQEKKESSAFDLAVVLLEAVAIAIVIRVFLFQPFNIPSGSMIPTLLVGDYLFVSKYSYGYSRYSFPFGLDLFSGRIFASDPNRGDVIVFKTPTDNSTDYIKRLVGLPGDRIQMIGGVLNINGVPVKRERAPDIVEDTKCGPNQVVHVYRETLPSGRSYLTQKLSETCRFGKFGAADDTEVFVVPPKHYFMMGDNRDDSADSRFSIGNGVGYVPEENLVGRARILVLLHRRGCELVCSMAVARRNPLVAHWRSDPLSAAEGSVQAFLRAAPEGPSLIVRETKVQRGLFKACLFCQSGGALRGPASRLIRCLSGPSNPAASS